MAPRALAPISTVQIGAAVQKVAFDSAGTRVVAVLGDATAPAVWKLGAQVAVARGVASEPGGSAIASAVFSPSGREVLTASVDGTARLWSAANGAEVGRAITEPLGGILSGAAFQPRMGDRSPWRASGLGSRGSGTSPADVN